MLIKPNEDDTRKEQLNPSQPRTRDCTFPAQLREGKVWRALRSAVHKHQVSTLPLFVLLGGDLRQLSVAAGTGPGIATPKGNEGKCFYFSLLQPGWAASCPRPDLPPNVSSKQFPFPIPQLRVCSLFPLFFSPLFLAGEWKGQGGRVCRYGKQEGKSQ